MDIETLAKTAAVVISSMPGYLSRDHGVEVASGFFNVYNALTGQSRWVLYHPESDYVFKTTSTWEVKEPENSGQHLGTVTLDGKTYQIRYPRMFYFDVDGETIEVQEYVHGESDPCLDTDSDGIVNAWCEHALLLASASGLSDCHTGNWKIAGDEIVIFDF